MIPLTVSFLIQKFILKKVVLLKELNNLVVNKPFKQNRRYRDWWKIYSEGFLPLGL